MILSNTFHELRNAAAAICRRRNRMPRPAARSRRSVLQLKAAVLLGLLAPGLVPDAPGALHGWDAKTNNNRWDEVEAPVGGPAESNWVGGGAGGVPGTGDTVIFADSYLVNPLRLVDLNGDRSVDGVALYGPEAYTLDAAVGADTLTVGNGIPGAENRPIDARVADHVINCNVLLNNTNVANVSEFNIVTGTLTIHGVVSGDDSLLKIESGGLVLSNANTVSGGIDVRAGTLRVTNVSGSATGPGPVVIESGATLDGDGSIAGSVTVDSGGTVSPGTSVGTLTAGAAFTLEGSYLCEIDGAASDRLDVDGTLDVSGATLNVSELAAASGRTYTIATCGSRVGTFAGVTGLPGGYNVIYGANAITVERLDHFHVNRSAMGTGDGSSWGSAFTRLRDALDVALPGDVIWVKMGIHRPDEGETATDNDRSSTFQIPPGVTLLGGFAGNETSADERDPDVHLTVLSGDIDEDDPHFNGVISSASNVGAGNAYSVVSLLVPQNTITGYETRLDGFTVTGGRSDDPNVNDNSFGGGFFIDVTLPADTPVVANCRFIGNHAVWGGGLLVHSNGACDVSSTIFQGNEASGFGGGAYFWSSAVTVSNSLFTGNAAGDDGGGIFNNRCGIEYLNCTLSGNAAGDDGGGIANQSTGPVSPMVNSIIWNNSASGTTTTINSSISNQLKMDFEYCLIGNLNASGTGNLNGADPNNDPPFVTGVDPSNAPSSGGDFNLTDGSPVIDAGDNTAVAGLVTDLAGRPRILGGTVDFGAYEADVVAPVITLVGDSVVMLYAGSGIYTEEGATAADAGDPSVLVVIGGDTVDPNTVGTYVITYDATDASGNVALQVTRTVAVTRPIFYVNAAAPDGGDGASWATAFNKLQDALDLTAERSPDSFGLHQEVWVLQGTYYPDEGVNQTDGNRGSTFLLKRGVSIYGGFSGNETDVDQRDPDAFITTLSGDLNQDDTGAMPGADNARHVVTAINADNRSYQGGAIDIETVLDGLRITGGRADGASVPDNQGGGLLYLSDARTSALLQDCELVSNTAVHGGAAASPRDASVYVKDSYIADNTASGVGGAWYSGTEAGLPFSQVVEFADSLLEGNSASHGGAYYGFDANVQFQRSIVRGNSSTGDGGAVLLRVGEASVRSSQITGNQADGDGGAIYAEEAVLVTDRATIAGSRCGGSGGGIFMVTSSLVLGGAVVWGNSDGSAGDSADDSLVVTGDLSSQEIFFHHSLVEHYDGSEGIGNLDGTLASNDPLFIAPNDPASAPTETGNFGLLFRSPLIDAGVSLNDDIDEVSPVGAASDIGAYEFVPTAYEEWFAPYYPGETSPDVIGVNADPNGDGVTNSGHFVTATAPDGSDGLSAQPEATTNGDTTTFTFRQSDRAASLNPDIEGSINMVDWDLPESFDGVVVTIFDDGLGTDIDGFGIDRIVVEVDRSVLDRLFVQQVWDLQ